MEYETLHNIPKKYWISNDVWVTIYKIYCSIQDTLL